MIKKLLALFVLGVFISNPMGFAINEEELLSKLQETDSDAKLPASPAIQITSSPYQVPLSSEVTLPTDINIPGTIREVRDLVWPRDGEVKAELISILQSNSQVLRFDRPLSRVAVSNAGICDITTLGAQEVLVYCTKPGRINLLAWDQESKIAIYDIQSVVDIAKLKEILKHIDSQGKYEVMPYGETVSVYGDASGIEKVAKVEEAIKKFSGRSISYVQVRNPKQILLEVRFAEIDRRASKEYGLDGEAITRFTTARFFTGETQSGAQGDDDDSLFLPRYGHVATHILNAPDPALANNFFDYTTPDFRVSAYIKWLETKNILKLTAHPNLIALDGEEASFVVGGETPYLTATTTSVNVEFKEFGTKLTFKPTVLDNGQIRLNMNTEVSELDFSSTVSLQGTVVPTLVKNTHKTVAELADNESLVVGGLINQRINRVEKKVPFLGDLPVLRKLFSRFEFDRKDIELLIVVTPHIVEPFKNPIKKDLYQTTQALESTAVFTPAYPDLQGDMINRLLVQGERYHDFDGFVWRRAEEIEKEFIEIKKRETSKEKVIHGITGKRIQEEINPNTVIVPKVPSAKEI